MEFVLAVKAGAQQSTKAHIAHDYIQAFHRAPRGFLFHLVAFWEAKNIQETEHKYQNTPTGTTTVVWSRPNGHFHFCSTFPSWGKNIDSN